jgi:hypothetical protein
MRIESDADLAKVRLAGGPQRRRAGFLQGRHEHGGENGNHDQQFDQRKTPNVPPARAFSVWMEILHDKPGE